MVICPRCGYEFDLKRSNKLRQIIEYIEIQDKVKLRDLHLHFRSRWKCSGNMITNILKKLGRDKIINIQDSIISITDEYIQKQKKLE